MSATDTATDPQQDDILRFEEAIERLEDIVRRMEEERVPLAELVEDYEEGMKLLKVCKASIDAARARVELISGPADGGETKLEAFDSAD